jgi:hypothetical protein
MSGISVAMDVLSIDRHHPRVAIGSNEFNAVLRIPGGQMLARSPENRQMKVHQDALSEPRLESADG